MKKLNKIALTVVLSCTTLIGISAQERCGTMPLYENHIHGHPEYVHIYDSINRIINEKSSTNYYKTENVIEIPVVVNLIGDVVINKLAPDNYMLIHQQIEILNEDYRKQAGTNGDGAGVDVGVEFCLANTDPSGVTSTGVNEISGSLGPYNYISDDVTIKGLVHWDPTQYLNLYVVSGLTDGILGYTTFPTEMATAPQLDGVVIALDYFSFTTDAHYGNGRTTTHEIGHWFNLHHTWGDVDGVCSDGGVADIPICENEYYSAKDAGCPAPTQCVAENATAGLPSTRQIANYMDYSDDLCMSMFTQDQANIVAATLSTLRPNISTSSSTACNSSVVQGHCSDGVQDYDELGVDCGGYDCPPCSGTSHCYNGIQDADETGIDCGGADCVPCPIPSHCFDNIKNGDETAVDCGGSCFPCFALQLCSNDDPFPVHNLGDIGPSHCTWWTDDANVECSSVSVNPPGGTISISSKSILVDYFLAKNSSQTTFKALNYIDIKPDGNCPGSYVDFVNSSIMSANIATVSCEPSQIFSAYTNHCPGGSRISSTTYNAYYYSKSQNEFAQVYPNPTTDLIYIESSKDYPICSIEVWDMLGNKLFSEKTSLITGTQNMIDISNFSNAPYIVLLKKDNTIILHSKIIKL